MGRFALFGVVALCAGLWLAPAVAQVDPVPGDCRMPFRPAIAVDGATASEAEIQAAHDMILRFQEQLRTYRACLDLEIAEAEAAKDERKLADLTRRFNESVDAEKEVVTAFNKELQEFRERTP